MCMNTTGTTPIVIDVAQDDLGALRGRILDFSDLKEGPALILTNSNNKSYGATRKSLRVLRLIGPGKRTNTVGVLLSGAAFIGMDDVDIGGFGEGILYGTTHGATPCGMSMCMDAGLHCISLDPYFTTPERTYGSSAAHSSTRSPE